MLITLPSGKTAEIKPLVEAPRWSRAREHGKAARRRKREQANGVGWTPAEWANHLVRLGNKCLCCGSQERIVPDHVTPLKRGGEHSLDNIQPLCYRCNLHKGLQIIDYRIGE
jgi:5-methylcytosine-specific restriction endonuclease McrA